MIHFNIFWLRIDVVCPLLSRWLLISFLSFPTISPIEGLIGGCTPLIACVRLIANIVLMLWLLRRRRRRRRRRGRLLIVCVVTRRRVVMASL